MTQEIYSDTSSSWLEIANSIATYGLPVIGRNGMKFKETLYWHGVFQNPLRRYINPRGRFINLPFAIAETLDILLDKNPGISWRYNSKIKQFINPKTGRYDGHYGDRIAAQIGLVPPVMSQIERVLEELHNSGSRRAVMTVHNNLLENWSGVDVACTLSLQFILRENKLNLVATLRSEDVYLGYCYDTFTFQFMQELFAAILGVEVGYYCHSVNSFHIYVSDIPKLLDIRNDSCIMDYPLKPMSEVSFNHEWRLAKSNLTALWMMASECIDGLMEPSRELFDAIQDPYLGECGKVFQAEGHRRQHSLGEVEWLDSFRNEFKHYFQTKHMQFELKDMEMLAANDST
jgi:thymidylate synthase